jgi:amidase
MVGLADAATAKARRPPSETGMLDRFVLDWAEFARKFTPEDVAQANAYFLKLEADYAAWMSGMDVFLSPVTKRTAPLLGTLYDPTVNFKEMFDRIANFGSYTAVQNAIGLPGMSVPAGLSNSGLPVGSHFVAPAGREGLLPAFGYEIEQAQPWRNMWAPVSLADI